MESLEKMMWTYEKDGWRWIIKHSQNQRAYLYAKSEEQAKRICKTLNKEGAE